MESIILDELYKLEVPVNISGYDCMKEPIKFLIINLETKSKMVKLLYPSVAKIVNKTSQQVQIEIRKLV